MDENDLLDLSSALGFECPHCGHVQVDEFEVIKPDSVQAMRCFCCAADFHFAVLECGTCGEEHPTAAT